MHNTTEHNTTLQYTNYTTPQLQLQQHLQLHYTSYTTLQLHYNYNSTIPHYKYKKQMQLHYTTLHPAVVVRWPLQALQPLQKHKSNHLSVHRSAIGESQQPTSPIGFQFLKLPPPPCAVLVVSIHIYIYVLFYFYPMIRYHHSTFHVAILTWGSTGSSPQSIWRIHAVRPELSQTALAMGVSSSWPWPTTRGPQGPESGTSWFLEMKQS